jgi:hypothetical protein
MWKNTVERGRSQMTIWHMSLHPGYLRLQTHNRNREYLLIFHCNNICKNAPQCFVQHTFPDMVFCILVVEWNHVCVKLSPLTSQFCIPPTTGANIRSTSKILIGRINQNTHSETSLSGNFSKLILFDLSLPWTWPSVVGDHELTARLPFRWTASNLMSCCYKFYILFFVG